ncbi:Fpg/Nei family DNA glycosylase [Corynebacterium sp. HS2168-gen11]|uniref:Fpg/Nei family DNA glycosylase n=1 Tax=Corynebacterium sp. HS2168-gen11 TaxID=2974027 RepID=UPI00216AEA50|nr:zinc finger domain-containing protein [Corynebacterium sp. HS2168-gen11]MCS4536453.1 Fpg/Nei family DNA glycosylase [Corynebacterium sp. HS2168-gen11]
MPEGHVIHRLARDLIQQFQGTSPTVTSPQGRFSAEAALVNHQPFIGAEAFGKHLFLYFDGPQPERIIWIHLGLIGTLAFEPPSTTRGQIRLSIATNTLAANLRGPQWCRLIDETQMQRAVAKLGADPLRSDAEFAPIAAKVRKSTRSIGSLLMDQKLFAGVGNIYRAETLFRLGISPTTAGNQLDDAQLQAIWDDLVTLMQDGVHAGRIDTVREEHTPAAMGRAPRKDDHGGEVYTYRRHGQPCYICGTPIATRSLEGRNLFWCPTCQQE